MLRDFDCEIDTPSDVKYDEERLELFEKQRKSTVNKLEHYKELELIKLDVLSNVTML